MNDSHGDRGPAGVAPTMADELAALVDPGRLSPDRVAERLAFVGFDDVATAHARLCRLPGDVPATRRSLAKVLPTLLIALADAATPDGSLVNFERFVQSVDDRAELFAYLASNPRAVEILVRLFVGSQYLTEILLRNTSYLRELTRHKRLADFKSREEFYEEAITSTGAVEERREAFDVLRRFQHWELLRIGACDSFGLMDLKSVTVQLSLLADALVRACLTLVARDLEVDPDGFCVVAFGKLGGEELNYSSDIDLVFLARDDATRFWQLGQRLIKALNEATGEGFLYRVDMRLRPWGRSGALVNTVESHVDYLREHGQAWERQALLKARVIAGSDQVGHDFLAEVEPLIFSGEMDDARANVREMKERIEAKLKRGGREWAEVKTGPGSIRDVEFVTQFLQLAYGRANRDVKSFNTLDALVRLADFGYLQADEYRRLASGYVFLRTIEHALQLVHHKQTHTLPEDERELAYLARRLDYPNAQYFLQHYHRHRDAIRSIYEKYIEAGELGSADATTPIRAAGLPDHLSRMQPSYSETYSREVIARHGRMLDRLNDDHGVEVEARPAENGDTWEVTIAGYDHPGDLSAVCGLFFVYGFNIVGGHAFSDEQLPANAGATPRRTTARETARPRIFVNSFVVEPPLEEVLPEVWTRYAADLSELADLHRRGLSERAQGRLAKRIAGALRDAPEHVTTPLPVSIEVDNDLSDRTTVLHIQGEDTKGFLYELTNSLILTSIDVTRLDVRSIGNSVFDTLYVTDFSGRKLTDESRLRELRAAIVLIKHFTHLLPSSPDPETALLHFRDFLSHLFEQPDWTEDFASLERSEVLAALARLLGVSTFLWEDFLRLQHGNLFPVVRDVDELTERKTATGLRRELDARLSSATSLDERRETLNAFKDREMFRVDMRHILGHVGEFGDFSRELTELVEVVVEAAHRICDAALRERFGEPRCESGGECPVVVCALGKAGGRELGYASDIELMFVHEGDGHTNGPESITTTEYYQHLVESFTQTIRARQEGIFQLDLRLRPYGRAGSLAVSLEAFETYYRADGPAWPYERQALVKLRPIAGDLGFGDRVMALRDRYVFGPEPFDVSAMRAMREKQLTQLVRAGTFNAKLSPGGLVDLEYLVQGLQIKHAHEHSSLREPNTREAMRALTDADVLTESDFDRLHAAYVFLRRLIDALRVVRGHAKDLTVPDPSGEQFEFLARRLEYGSDLARLQVDLEEHTAAVVACGDLLDAAAD